MELFLCILTAGLLCLNLVLSLFMKLSMWKLFVLYIVLIASLISTTMCMTYGTIDLIEVYRGNTKLIITEKIENGVVVERDSTVVLKN